MNIAYINKSWTNKIPDGIATYTKTIAHLMTSRGHQVHVITLFDDNFRSQDPKLVFHLVKTHIPDSWLKLKFFQIIETFIFQLGAFRQYRSVAKDIDAIESPDAAAEGFFIALFCNRKLVTRLHTPLIFCSTLTGQNPEIGRRIIGWMEYVQVFRSRKLSSPSKILPKKILPVWNLPSQIEIIPNALKPVGKITAKFRPANFIFVGGFDADEGLNRFQHAFSDLRKNFPNLTAYAVGKFSVPSKKSKVTGLTHLGIVNQVELLGRIKCADAVVFAARWENFPYALQEARLLGKITVCPKVGGFAEIVKDGFDGLLYNIDSKNGLFGSMKQCLNLSKKDRRKIGERASKKAQQYLGPNLISKFEKYYLKSKV
jgi:glycosyltransferase involved in cell wall biosynthesis